MNRPMRSLVALAAMSLFSAQAPARDVVIHAGRLIDGVTASPRTKVSILIKDDRVDSVQSGFMNPAGAEVIDLTGATVLPGLIDAHVHLTSAPREGSPIARKVTYSTADAVLTGLKNARTLLDKGFTSVRDVSGPTEAVVTLKHAIGEGEFPGPRMWVAGNALGPTGGHSDARNGLAPGIDGHGWDDRVVDGADEATKAVRRLRREGVDLIKIMASGGVRSVGDNPDHTLMSEEEIGAIVKTAHALGMKVAAHATGKGAIDLTTRLGVDSIEHGTLGDSQSHQLMKEHGTYLIPTMLVAHLGVKMAREHPERLGPSSAAKAIRIGSQKIENVRNAYRAGVKFAFGTDTQEGLNAEEFALLVGAGIPAEAALLTATRNAADVLGASADVGTIQPGRYADIIAVMDDPLRDISVLERVAFVMKGGEVVRALQADGR